MQSILFAASAINTGPLIDTLKGLLIIGLVAIGCFVLVTALHGKIAKAILVGCVLLIGLGIAGIGISGKADSVATGVGDFFISIIPHS
jgi:hypothetical protein